MKRARSALWWCAVAAGLAACSLRSSAPSEPDCREGPREPATAIAAPPQSAAASPAPRPSASSVATATPLQVKRDDYAWLTDPSIRAQSVDGSLEGRVAPPPGFTRVALAGGSFGAWLRGLPLRPSGPVVDYRGRTILAADDPRLTAVVALDEGSADLQQCADAIMRLFAEWQWHSGVEDVHFRAAAGTDMPYATWLRGGRVKAQGNRLVWRFEAKDGRGRNHATFRTYLDDVFMWANTGSLRRDAASVSDARPRPGDFFVLAGAPGHAVLVLDVAENAAGERAALLGQSYMPAQSFHVLRPSASAAVASGSAWFRLDPASEGVDTPFWPAPFPWSSLRRFE